MLSPPLKHAYGMCRKQAAAQHENFPVASWFLPTTIRNPVAAIYCFARTADDYADEGELTQQARLDRLTDMASALDALAQRKSPAEPLYLALQHTIRSHALPISLFHDLLRAFRQDVTKSRYRDFSELLRYCSYSANPVGRLMLHLNNCGDPRDFRDADSICTALQLINFVQDVRRDYTERGRIYIPLDELRRFGVGEAQLAERSGDTALQQLLALQINRACKLLRQGAPLAARTGGRFGFELRLVVAGGARILANLARPREDLLSGPRLTIKDRARMFLHAAGRRLPKCPA